MRCNQVQPMLSAYADGELTPKCAARIAEHLGNCEACTTELRSLARLVAVLHALPEEELPAELHGAILQTLDMVRPSFWQRLSATVPALQPVRPLAFGTVAAALAILALTAPPVHHGSLHGTSVARIPYSGPTERIAAAAVVAAAPAAPSKALMPTTPAPRRDATSTLPAATPTILQTASDARTTPPDPTSRLAAAPRTAAARTERRPKGRRGTDNGAARPADPAPMSVFDPLAPVLEPTGSRTDPPMANVVLADGMTAGPQSDVNLMASAPGGTEVATASNASDDLTSLRERLAQEQFQLPAVQFKPRPRPTKGAPLLHGEF